jgi:hypothetical protein
MALGLLEYMVLGCAGNQFTSEIVPQLNALQEKGFLRVVDVLLVRKHAMTA